MPKHSFNYLKNNFNYVELNKLTLQNQEIFLKKVKLFNEYTRYISLKKDIFYEEINKKILINLEKFLYSIKRKEIPDDDVLPIIIKEFNFKQHNFTDSFIRDYIHKNLIEVKNCEKSRLAYVEFIKSTEFLNEQAFRAQQDIANNPIYTNKQKHIESIAYNFFIDYGKLVKDTAQKIQYDSIYSIKMLKCFYIID